MRQLASTLVDGKLRYYLADEETGELDEIAVIKAGPGFDASEPTAMISLGFGLVHDAGYNGHRRKRNQPPALVAEPPTALPPAPVVMPGRQRRNERHRVTVEEIVDYVHAHPGARPSQIADALVTTPGANRIKRSQVVGNRLASYFDQCKRQGVAPAIRKVQMPGHVTQLYPVETSPAVLTRQCPAPLVPLPRWCGAFARAWCDGR